MKLESGIVGDSTVTGRQEEVMTVSAPVNLAGEEFKLWYRVTGGMVSEESDAFLAATLIPAMRSSSALHLTGRVSRALLDNSAKVQDIIHNWYPEFKRIPVTSERVAEPAAGLRERGVGCFFSAGVDSFFTLLKHRKEITHLIYLHGFDIWLHEEEFRAGVLKEVQKIAKDFGKSLIFVETNIHEFSDRFADWGLHYHGSALASVALLLAPQLRTVYIPSSYAYHELFPWASHPLLDPAWSTEQLQIVHDGNEAGRVEKTALIAQSEVVLHTLRVCVDRRAGLYNCGRCEKCLRTMINLRLVDALHRCATFNGELDLKAVAALRLHDDHELIFAKENLRAAEAKQDKELAAALRQTIKKYERQLLLGRVKASSWSDRKWVLLKLLKEQFKNWGRNIAHGQIRRPPGTN